jgi:hypothetical protein
MACSTKEITMAKQQRSVPDAIHVQKYLGGLDYPVGKSELIDKAEQSGADKQTIQALEKIPERQYESPVSVSREVSKLH